MTWSRKQAESLGFPRKFCNPVLFALTVKVFQDEDKHFHYGEAWGRIHRGTFQPPRLPDLHGNMQLKATHTCSIR